MMTERIKRPRSKDKNIDLVDRYKEIGISAVAAAVHCSLAQSRPKKSRSKGKRKESVEMRTRRDRGS
jgi:hypothetical protein